MRQNQTRTLLAALMLTAGGLALLGTLAAALLSYGLPPCESDMSVFWSRLSIGFGLIIGAGLVLAPSAIALKVRLLIAFSLPIFLVGAHILISQSNEVKQAACAERTLAEAMESCGANPTHYSIGRDQEGYETLSLIAPGTTDETWLCLEHWQIHAEDAPSLKIDESVYSAAQIR